MTPTALRWLRTLRTIRRRVQDSVPPPGRYLLIVTPTDPTSGVPLHVESGGENEGDHWALLDRGGEVAKGRGPSLVTVCDLDEPDPELATVAWLHLDADGNVTTRPPGADAAEGASDMSDERRPTESPLDPGALLSEHKRSGEPLDEAEVSAIVAAGLARPDEFDMRGGDLWWHTPTWPEPDGEAEVLPAIEAGDPCPACGGAIVVDGTVTYTRVPVLSDGTPTDEGGGGDFEFDGDPYCGDCGQRVRVEL